tara:strand:- start:2435 stop:3955 length:1521 start_codon:yes stop_codon:yes gene_type:complete
MAQQRQNIYIAAPGFKGLNTQDSPVTQDSSFASVAENAVIDKFGRIAARKGIKKITSSATPLGSSAGIEAVFEFCARDGTKTIFSAGNNKIFTGTTTLSEVTLPGGYTISANNWKIVSFNNDVYFFQKSHAALVSVAGSTTLVAVTDSGTAAPAGNEVLAAFGRLFVADVANNSYTLHFSDLLDGDDYHSGSSGSLDVTTVWPEGYDEIVALQEFNNFLVIFGKRSILIYQGASSPASMTLSDTITGIGCIARDSVQSIGTDLIFLSDSGLRSLGRVIQEKSNPIGNVSKNVRDTLMASVTSETGNIKSVYSPEESFYLLLLPTSSEIYVFDMRGTLEDGSYRATTWKDVSLLSGVRTTGGLLYFGSSVGINQYDGFLDDTSSYEMKYFTNPMSFGDPSKLKMLKEISFTVIGGSESQVVGNWAYDYREDYSTQSFTIAKSKQAEYGISEYNVATSQYGVTNVIDIASIKATGAGKVATIGIEATINGGSLSIQELNTEALLGRLI